MKTTLLPILLITVLIISCTNVNVKEKLDFEADNIKFEITDKSTSQEEIDFFLGFKLNSRTGQFDPNVKTESPAKGMIYVKFKINVTNFNSDTVKINSESDMIVQTSDGAAILKYTEFPDLGFSSGAFTATLLPEKPKEMEFFLIIPEKQMKEVKLLYKNKEGATINFMNSMDE